MVTGPRNELEWHYTILTILRGLWKHAVQLYPEKFCRDLPLLALLAKLPIGVRRACPGVGPRP